MSGKEAYLLAALCKKYREPVPQGLELPGAPKRQAAPAAADARARPAPAAAAAAPQPAQQLQSQPSAGTKAEAEAAKNARLARIDGLYKLLATVPEDKKKLYQAKIDELEEELLASGK